MWQTGSAGIGSEHFITNIIRQRIILAIDSLPYLEKSEGCKRVILFLPENELHEIGLLYYTYMIRKLGHETLYLGQTTPLTSVIDVNDQWNADIIITGLKSGYPDVSPDDIIRNLQVIPRPRKYWFPGYLQISSKMKLLMYFRFRSDRNTLRTQFNSKYLMNCRI